MLSIASEGSIYTYCVLSWMKFFHLGGGLRRCSVQKDMPPILMQSERHKSHITAICTLEFEVGVLGENLPLPPSPHPSQIEPDTCMILSHTTLVSPILSCKTLQLQALPPPLLTSHSPRSQLPYGATFLLGHTSNKVHCSEK